MKSLLSLGVSLVVALLVASSTPAISVAQVLGLPDRSPAASVYERVGVTDIKIKYHRPAVRDRQIWGNVVPYGLAPALGFFGNGKPYPWRAGANDNTTIYFEHDVLVEGQPLSAGKYALYMIPSESDWTVVFNEDHSSWGSFFYEEERDVLHVTVIPVEGPFQERMGFAFQNQDDSGGVTIALAWENLVVPFRVQVADYQQTVLASLDAELKGRPGLTPASWAAAVNYCTRTAETDDICVAWADVAIQRNPGFNSQVAKADLLRQRGDEVASNEAIEAAMASANENELNIYGYQLMQRGEIDRAIAVFTQNVERHPESWNVYDSLAEGYANKGDAQRAITYYSKALEMVADDGQKDRIRGALSNLRGGTD
ncbi:MAG: DUF2911 domain-containing protein [Rhodothermales bacterium]|nr:DUF2911 domain-containing protein [Rhodothermales bacterium]